MRAFAPHAKCEYTEDPGKLNAGSLKAYDALSMLTCFAAEDDGLKDKSLAVLPQDARKSVEDFVSGGRAFLPLHSTMCSYTHWEQLSRMIGIRWVWGTSFHGPHETYTLRVSRKHPLAAEFRDIEVHDELYRLLKPVVPVDMLMEVDWEGKPQPHAWTLSYGKGRVFFWGPGHKIETFDIPAVQESLGRGLKWALGE